MFVFLLYALTKRGSVFRIVLLFVIILSHTASFALEVGTPVINTPYKSFPFKLSMHEGSYKYYDVNNMDDVCENVIKLKGDVAQHPPMIQLKIMCLAFKSVNVHLDIEVIPTNSHARSVRDVENARSHSFAGTEWTREVDKNSGLLISKPLFRIGEVEKGIFTNKNHPIRKLAPEDIDLKNFDSITVESWVYDYALLFNLSKSVINSTNLSSIVSMLNARRADFTIIEFPRSDDLIFTSINTQSLYPVMGVKVIYPFSRSFVISKRADNAVELLSKLNEGMQLLREQGLIVKTLKEHGLISPLAENWRVIQPLDSCFREIPVS